MVGRLTVSVMRGISDSIGKLGTNSCTGVYVAFGCSVANVLEAVKIQKNIIKTQKI